MNDSHFCPKCGTGRVDDFRFCGTCGLDLAPQAAGVAPTSTQGLVPPPSGTVERNPEVTAESVALADSLPAPRPASKAHSSKGGGDNRIPAIAALVAILGIASLAYFGYKTSQDLAGVRIDLGSTSADLAAETSKRSSADAEVSRLTAVVADLTNQVSRQTACIASLNADEVELNRIHEVQRTNFNRGAKDSRLGKAEVADRAALNAAIADYFKAYTAAFNGSLSTANSWVDKGNAQIKKSNTQVTIIDAEVGLIDKTTKQIEADLAALSSRIVATQTTCGFTASGSG